MSRKEERVIDIISTIGGGKSQNKKQRRKERKEEKKKLEREKKRDKKLGQRRGKKIVCINVNANDILTMLIDMIPIKSYEPIKKPSEVILRIPSLLEQNKEISRIYKFPKLIIHSQENKFTLVEDEEDTVSF